MAWKSLAIFRDFKEISGISSGYVRTGYFLIVGNEDRLALQDNIGMQQRIGIDTSLVTAEEVGEIAPMLSVQRDETIAYEPYSGYADPYLVTTGYATRAREMGAQVKMGSLVTGIEIKGNKVAAVITATERIETPIAVIANGPWAPKFLQNIGIEAPLQTIRHQVVMVKRPDGIPDHPIVGDVVNGLSARPEIGNLTLVGVGEDEQADPDDYNRSIDMPMAERTLKSLTTRIRGMDQAQFRGGWSGLFTVTPDWHPILDMADGIDGLYFAIGFSGHGFKLSPMVGVVMSELITQGHAKTIDISMLNFRRFRNKDLLRSRYGMSVLA